MTHFRQSSLFLAVPWALALGAVLLAPNWLALRDPGDFCIRNTVRLALIYWSIAAALMLRSLSSTARLAWTLGCVAFLVHVAMAFEHAHHWSHVEAFRHVETVSGYGEGIFVSYMLTIVWTVDVLWWWLKMRRYLHRQRWVGWMVHGFMVFVIINETVVFENGQT